MVGTSEFGYVPAACTPGAWILIGCPIGIFPSHRWERITTGMDQEEDHYTFVKSGIIAL
jgi:hypothetical protein